MFQSRFKLARAAAACAIAIGIVVAASSLGVVRAERFSPDKKSKTSFKCSSGTACLTADSTGAYTYAISAVGASANTIQAQTGATNGDSAIAGIATSSSGRAEGVYAASNNGDGVYGITNTSSYAGVYGLSTNGYGTYGQSKNNYGAYGQSTNGYGLYGQSSANYGVAAFSAGDTAAYFENDTESATIFAENEATYGYTLSTYNSTTGDEFYVDEDADGVFDGYVLARGGFSTVRRARGGEPLETFGAESTRATLEDTGTARLETGEGAVRFDPAFANTIDAARGYQVFLTPTGETRGWLYVAAKYEGGFVVREAEHGRSSIYFDYRVVAHPYGVSDARLPQLSIERPQIPRALRRVQSQQR